MGAQTLMDQVWGDTALISTLGIRLWEKVGKGRETDGCSDRKGTQATGTANGNNGYQSAILLPQPAVAKNELLLRVY